MSSSNINKFSEFPKKAKQSQQTMGGIYGRIRPTDAN